MCKGTLLCLYLTAIKDVYFDDGSCGASEPISWPDRIKVNDSNSNSSGVGIARFFIFFQYYLSTVKVLPLSLLCSKCG